MAAQWLGHGVLDLVERLERGADPRWLQWALIAHQAEHEAREAMADRARNKGTTQWR